MQLCANKILRCISISRLRRLSSWDVINQRKERRGVVLSWQTRTEMRGDKARLLPAPMLRLAADTVTVTRANSDEMGASHLTITSQTITLTMRGHMGNATKSWWLVNKACFRAHVLKLRGQKFLTYCPVGHALTQNSTSSSKWWCMMGHSCGGGAAWGGGGSTGIKWYVLCDTSDEMRNKESSNAGGNPDGGGCYTVYGPEDVCDAGLPLRLA